MVRREEKVGFVTTATIQGVEAVPVTVEVSVGSGLPGIHIVGMPDTAIQEAKQRVRQALKAAHFEMRNRFVVVNLAPGSVRKVGSGFDLPIALGFLIATEQINPELVRNRLCVGELSLDGSVKPVLGQLAYEQIAQAQGWGLMTGPTVAGVFTQQGQEHVCLEHISNLRDGCFAAPEAAPPLDRAAPADYSDVAGNDLAKRALQIAAAGSHGILMTGPPGSGKSMLASRLPSILPPLLEDERVESALIHSVAGLPFERILQGERPFRAPHHGASRAGLIGGGNPTRAGEVSLAHNGVLFLDELPEFGTSVLQLLRQPMEQEFVTLARASGTVVFPARFMLVAASNPCPCGFYGDPKRSCTCTAPQISRYQGRVGGPLMDRIGIIVDVWRSDAAHVLNTGRGTTSAQLREGVMRARAFAVWRHARDEAQGFKDVPAGVGATMAVTAATGSGAALLASCRLGTKERASLEMMAERYQLSGRGIMGTLAVARTIADMEESERVTGDHLMEALGFRKNDRESAVA
ncbi:MAG: YifB family Mg chelatase-like AAA ATPase [Coriobacteriales bacterium]|jgi:magnesium chelatase family protein|nr:YifB family Mg chelatase-like AAA ATPase [Coriobacteriales bacterium]